MIDLQLREPWLIAWNETVYRIEKHSMPLFRSRNEALSRFLQLAVTRKIVSRISDDYKKQEIRTIWKTPSRPVPCRFHWTRRGTICRWRDRPDRGRSVHLLWKRAFRKHEKSNFRKMSVFILLSDFHFCQLLKNKQKLVIPTWDISKPAAVRVWAVVPAGISWSLSARPEPCLSRPNDEHLFLETVDKFDFWPKEKRKRGSQFFVHTTFTRNACLHRWILFPAFFRLLFFIFVDF